MALIKEGSNAFPSAPGTGFLGALERQFKQILGNQRGLAWAEEKLGRAVFRALAEQLGGEEKEGRFEFHLLTREDVSELGNVQRLFAVVAPLEGVRDDLSALNERCAEAFGAIADQFKVMFGAIEAHREVLKELDERCAAFKEEVERTFSGFSEALTSLGTAFEEVRGAHARELQDLRAQVKELEEVRGAHAQGLHDLHAALADLRARVEAFEMPEPSWDDPATPVPAAPVSSGSQASPKSRK